MYFEFEFEFLQISRRLWVSVVWHIVKRLCEVRVVYAYIAILCVVSYALEIIHISNYLVFFFFYHLPIQLESSGALGDGVVDKRINYSPHHLPLNEEIWSTIPEYGQLDGDGFITEAKKYHDQEERDCGLQQSEHQQPVTKKTGRQSRQNKQDMKTVPKPGKSYIYMYTFLPIIF